MSDRRVKAPLMLTTFAASLSSLSLELALTRVYSFLLVYHYVFIAVSVSVLGLGLGSWWVYARGKQFLQARRTDREILGGLVGSAVSAVILLPAVFFLASTQAWPLGLFISAMPFVFVGRIMATVFFSRPEWSSALYFADLAGAAAGALAAPMLLNFLGPVGVILGLGVVLLLAVAMLGGRRAGSFALAGAIALVAAILINERVDPTRYLSPFTKPMAEFIRVKKDEVRWLYSKWAAFSRLDLLGDDDETSRVIFTDGGAGTRLYRFDGSLESIDYLRGDLNFLPFILRERAKTLIIGPGGGKEVLLALLGGSTDIDAVEVNPGMFEIARRFADFAGNIYDRPEVSAIVADGRGFAERSSERYDIIFLPLVLTQAAEAQGYALAENYVFTREAFETYYDRLNEGGYLAVRAHDEPEMFRVILTWLEVLKDKAGVSPSKGMGGVAVFGESPHQHRPGRLDMPLIILKRTPFDDEELALMQLYAGMNPLSFPVYVPGTSEPGQLGAIKNGSLDAAKLAKSAAEHGVDIRPATDDRPFFYNTLTSLPKTMSVLLAAVSAIAALFAGFVFVEARRGRQRFGWQFPVYFALLGLAFMMIEVPLLQKLILLYGTPLQAMSLTLFALLLSGALGSLTAGRLPIPAHRTAVIASAAVGLLALVYLAVLPGAVDLLIAQGAMVRTAGGVGLVVPLGFLMGMPFPSGLRHFSQVLPNSVALAWAVNGVFSVAGSVLTAALAMKTGFSVAIVVGAVLYILAGMSLGTVKRAG